MIVKVAVLGITRMCFFVESEYLDIFYFKQKKRILQISFFYYSKTDMEILLINHLRDQLQR
mgnify:CR=1 FL=1